MAIPSSRVGGYRTPGNGRVYHIDFTADDGRGGSCHGVLTVCVPYRVRRDPTCVDEGPLHDSSLADGAARRSAPTRQGR